EQLGIWGKRWTRAQIEKHELDAGFLMWDVRRKLRADRLPTERTVIQFLFSGTSTAKRRWWLIAEHAEVELCFLDPGFEVDIHVRTHIRTLTEVWLGDRACDEALESGAIALEGPKELTREFASWFHWSPLAGVERERAASE